MIMMLQSNNEASADRNRELDGLLRRMAGGDRAALAEVYRRTRGAVYAMALSYLKEPESAGDVTQDAFVRIWESAPGYRSKGSPMAWILTVTRNLALMELRQRGRTTAMDETEWEAIPAPAPSVTPEDRQLLQNALGRLSEEDRRIVLLHAVSGLKHREIARLLELPLSTVLSKYNRGLKKVKSMLEEEYT